MKTKIAGTAISLMVLAAATTFGRTYMSASGGGVNASFTGWSGLVSDGVIDGGETQFDARQVVFEEPKLAGGGVFELYVTTTSDIRNIALEFSPASMNEPGGWYNHPSRFDSEFIPLLVAFEATFATDMWVTTPGDTLLSFGPTKISERNIDAISVRDLKDDGPQSDFNFARITLIPDANSNADVLVRGIVATAPTDGGINSVIDEFEYRLILGVPEPAVPCLVFPVFLGLALSRRRRKQNRRR